MDQAFVVARAESGAGGLVRILSPGVGLWSGRPRSGAPLGPAGRIGSLTCLKRRFALLLPPGVGGSVHSAISSERVLAVEYGELLFELAPLTADATRLGSRERAAGPGIPASADAGAVTSPTDGTFYRSPVPGAAPFVEVGSRLTTGDPVGLVEVMKTFNRVLYGGPGLPETAEVVEVRAADSEEVRAGQILLVVR